MVGSFGSSRRLEVVEATRSLGAVWAVALVAAIAVALAAPAQGSDGTFERAWGKDVIQPAAPGNLGAVFEICTVAANCQAGGNGGLAGELNVPTGLATDPAGNVYVADLVNNR